jgi:diaminohydroxyphosphoribosylaminopyrimidine deaminase / 5-amino-6-(5-phosphoribosylamino)uracil reductase
MLRSVTCEHETWMRLAIEEAEQARGTTGDNPWVGCAIVSPHGELVGRGHTLGPGEDHAEIAERGIVRVVIGMRDPHPRVNGAGTLILRNAGVEVIEGVCEPEVRRQLGLWVLEQHPHEPLRRAQTLPEQQRVSRLAEVYGVDRRLIEVFLAKHLLSDEERISHTDDTAQQPLAALGGRCDSEPPRLKRIADMTSVVNYTDLSERTPHISAALSY